MQIKTTRNDLRSAEPIVLWAVYAKEKNPPPGAKAIEWLLLTTKQVQTSEDAVRIVQYYCLSRRIEEWHRVLKGGCKVRP